MESIHTKYCLEDWKNLLIFLLKHSKLAAILDTEDAFLFQFLHYKSPKYGRVTSAFFHVGFFHLYF